MAGGWKPNFNFSFFKTPPNPGKVEKVSAAGPKSSMMQSFNHDVSKFISSSPFNTLCLPPLASRTQQAFQGPPSEFQCPITGSLLHDPITLPNGLTLERVFIEAFRECNYIPSSPFHLPTNEVLKSKILEWCDLNGRPRPRPISREEACSCIKGFLAFYDNFQSGFTKVLEDDNGGHFLNPRNQLSPSSSSSKDDKTIVCPLRKFKKIREPAVEATSPRIACNRSPPSYFSEAMEALNRSETAVPDSSSLQCMNSYPKEDIIKNLEDNDSSVQESALGTLRRYAQIGYEQQISLCSERILQAIVSMLRKFTHAEVNSVLLFISLLASEKSNREKLAHFDGFLNELVNILERSPVAEARNLTANVLEALSREDVNKRVMGKELLRLLDYFSSVNDQCSDIGKTIWNLCVDCPANVLKILKNVVAPLKLLYLSANRSQNIAFPSMMVLMELAELEEGKRALMGAGAVVTLINMMREGTGDEEHCLSLLYQIQTRKGNNELFKRLAVSAEAEEVLIQNKEEWGEMGREKARRMLEFIRIGD